MTATDSIYGGVLGQEKGELCCRNGCCARLELEPSKNCSCHLNPPCTSCLKVSIYCPDCGWRKMMNSIHLGDGVYLSFDGYQLWLAVNHHENKVVALEPRVFYNLMAQGEKIFINSKKLVEPEGEEDEKF